MENYEKKIKEYVEYVLRDNNDLKDNIDEISGNIYLRFQELVQKGYKEQDAYIEALKKLGDFKIEEDDKPESHVKPSFPEMGILVGLIFAAFGLLMIILDSIVGLIFITMSITIYVISSHYLFSLSQYVRKNEMDILKQNIYLNKITKHLRCVFTLWSISISYLLASIFPSIYVKIKFSDSISNINNQNLIMELYDVSKIMFIVLIIIFLLISFFIYRRIKNNFDYLKGISNKENNSNKFFPNLLKEPLFYYAVVILLFTISFMCKISYYVVTTTGLSNSTSSFFTYCISGKVSPYILGLFFIVLLIITVLFIRDKKKNMVKTIIYLSILYILYSVLLYIYLNENNSINGNLTYLISLNGISISSLLIFILLITGWINIIIIFKKKRN